MNGLRTTLSVLVLSALTASCSDPPTAPPIEHLDQPSFNMQASPRFFPFTTTVAGCAELVDIEGSVSVFTKALFDSNGSGHYTLHWGLKGTGIGRSSGTPYVFGVEWVGTSNGMWGSWDSVGTSQQAIRLIALGGGDNQLITLTFHVTPSPGNPEDVYVTNAVCVG